MSDPVQETIAQAVLAKLTALVSAKSLASASRATLAGMPDSPEDKSAFLVQMECAEDSAQLQGYKNWVQAFDVYLFVRPSDRDTAAVDTAINALRADVEKQLLSDLPAGDALFGLADNAAIRAPLLFELGEACVGAIVRLEVSFRHLEFDPYSQ
ncbi:MAG TPA: hypothetical protein VFH53_07300 [Phycisphaerae bacterium]|nr:hypothetical protein [Phycisphaerae bacterium]